MEEDFHKYNMEIYVTGTLIILAVVLIFVVYYKWNRESPHVTKLIQALQDGEDSQEI